MSEPHLQSRHGEVGEPQEPPSPAEFAAQARDGRQGDAISDQPYGDAALHEKARDAVAWDETTND